MCWSLLGRRCLVWFKWIDQTRPSRDQTNGQEKNQIVVKDHLKLEQPETETDRYLLFDSKVSNVVLIDNCTDFRIKCRIEIDLLVGCTWCWLKYSAAHTNCKIIIFDNVRFAQPQNNRNIYWIVKRTYATQRDVSCVWVPITVWKTIFTFIQIPTKLPLCLITSSARFTWKQNTDQIFTHYRINQSIRLNLINRWILCETIWQPEISSIGRFGVRYVISDKRARNQIMYTNESQIGDHRSHHPEEIDVFCGFAQTNYFIAKINFFLNSCRHETLSIGSTFIYFFH